MDCDSAPISLLPCVLANPSASISNGANAKARDANRKGRDAGNFAPRRRVAIPRPGIVRNRVRKGQRSCQPPDGKKVPATKSSETGEDISCQLAWLAQIRRLSPFLLFFSRKPTAWPPASLPFKSDGIGRSGPATGSSCLWSPAHVAATSRLGDPMRADVAGFLQQYGEDRYQIGPRAFV